MRSALVGVPRTEMIATKCSREESEKNKGSPKNISAMTQPADQTSMAKAYPVQPNANYGAR